MRLEFTRKTDVQTGSVVTDLDIVINAKEIRSGKYKKIDMELLLAIVSFMDEEKKCFPTQKQLAEILNVTPKTVRNRLTKLLEVEIDGKPLINREFYNARGGKRASEYTLNSPVEKEKKQDYNSKNVIDYFCTKYMETYHVKYAVNGKREGSLIKSKLIDNYSQQQIESTIDYIMEHYQSKWATKGYPRPTLGMLCGWLFNSAQGFMTNKPVIEEEDTDKYFEAFDKSF